MGKSKYSDKIESLFKSPVVDFKSIQRIANRNKQYTKQIIKNLIAKGKIKRLTKGYYTAYDDPSLIVYCFKPAYLGLQDALSFHDLWEQETIPVIITTAKARPGIRTVMGANVLIRRISKKLCFGFNYYKQGDIYLPYSDVEKTFLDFRYFKVKLNEETVKNINKKIDRKKLNSYLTIYPNKIKDKIKTAFL